MAEDTSKKQQRPKLRPVSAKPDPEPEPDAAGIVPGEEPVPATAVPDADDAAPDIVEPSADPALNTEPTVSSGEQTEGAQASYADRLRFHRRKRRR